MGSRRAERADRRELTRVASSARAARQRDDGCLAAARSAGRSPARHFAALGLRTLWVQVPAAERRGARRHRAGHADRSRSGARAGGCRTGRSPRTLHRRGAILRLIGALRAPVIALGALARMELADLAERTPLRFSVPGGRAAPRAAGLPPAVARAGARGTAAVPRRSGTARSGADGCCRLERRDRDRGAGVGRAARVGARRPRRTGAAHREPAPRSTTWSLPPRRQQPVARDRQPAAASAARSTRSGASASATLAGSASPRCSPARAARARRWPPK